MAITRVQTAQSHIFGGLAQPHTVTYGSTVVSGNTSILVIRGTPISGFSSVPTDTRGTVYTELASSWSAGNPDPPMWIFSGRFTSSGTNTVSIHWSSAEDNYVWVEAIEASFDGNASLAVAAVGTYSLEGAITIASASVSSTAPALFVMGASETTDDPFTSTTDTLGNAWNLISGTIGTPDTPDGFGIVHTYISPGAYGPVSGQVTSTTGGIQYSTVVAVFQSAVPITRVQTCESYIYGASPIPHTASFSTNVTAGNLSVLVVRGTDLSDITGVPTDTRGTTYVHVTSVTSVDPSFWIYAGILPTTGANTVTIPWTNATTNWVWVVGIEVNFNGDTSSAVAWDADYSATGASTQASGPVTTTTHAFFVMGASEFALDPYTSLPDSLGGTWQLINGAIGAPDERGMVHTHIHSGAYGPVSGRAGSTSGTVAYSTIIAAFSPGTPPPPGLGGGGHFLTLLGVGG